MDGDVMELWVESYQGEVLGEAFFAQLASTASDPVQRHELDVLTLLERATKQLAEPLFDRHGIDRGDSAMSIEVAGSFAGALASATWEEIAESVLPVTEVFLAKYRSLVSTAEDDDEREIAVAYVAHEEALATWARRALGEEAGDPLEEILALPHVAAAVASS